MCRLQRVIDTATRGRLHYLDPPYLPGFTRPGGRKSLPRNQQYTAKTFERSDIELVARFCVIGLSGALTMGDVKSRHGVGQRIVLMLIGIIRFTLIDVGRAESTRIVEALCLKRSSSGGLNWLRNRSSGYFVIYTARRRTERQ